MSFLGDIFHGVTGAIGGLVTGGPLGAIGGAVAGITGASSHPQPAPTGFPSTPPIAPTGYTVPVLTRPSPAATTPPAHTYGIDINPPFGGAPGAGINIGTGGSQFLLGIGQGLGQGAAQQAGQALQRRSGSSLPMIGAVGMAPVVRTEAVSKCPPGYVLAVDGNCYPKSMVPRKWRKWKPRKKGPISAREWKTLKTANRVRKKAVKLAHEAGLKGGKKSW